MKREDQTSPKPSEANLDPEIEELEQIAAADPIIVAAALPNEWGDDSIHGRLLMPATISRRVHNGCHKANS